MNNQILVIGKTGQLARALSESDHTVCVGRDTLDLSWKAARIRETLSTLLDAQCPFVGVINAAAYTDVDTAETDRDTAQAVNAKAVGVIARFCAAVDLPLIHVSTDYVFDGQGTAPYAPNYPTAPINVYGISKRGGEIEVEDSGATYAVLRTSWVYDAEGKNFMTSMLRLAQTRDTLGVVKDQLGRPTFADDLAAASLAALQGLQDGRASGIYHVSNTGSVISWSDFARAIFDSSGDVVTVNGIPSSDYPTPAARPAYSAMDTASFETTFKHILPSWQDGLRRAFSAHAKLSKTNQQTTPNEEKT